MKNKILSFINNVKNKIKRKRKVLFFLTFFLIYPLYSLAKFEWAFGDSFGIPVDIFNKENDLNWSPNKGSDTSELLYFLSFMVKWIAMILVQFAAMFFDNMFAISIYPDFYDQDWISTTWGLIRDLINIGFIFGIIVIGFKMIFGDNGWKKMLIFLIIAAFTLNFSLFFGRVIIDAGNYTSALFYKLITFKGETNGNQKISSGEKSGFIKQSDYFDISAKLLGKSNFNPYYFNKPIATNLILYTQASNLSSSIIPIAKKFGVSKDEWKWGSLFSKVIKESTGTDSSSIINFIGVIINVFSIIVYLLLAKSFMLASFAVLARVFKLIGQLILAPVAFAQSFLPFSENGSKPIEKWAQDTLTRSFCILPFLLGLFLLLVFISRSSMFNNSAKSGVFIIFAVLFNNFVIYYALNYITEQTTKMCDAEGWAKKAWNSLDVLGSATMTYLKWSPAGIGLRTATSVLPVGRAMRIAKVMGYKKILRPLRRIRRSVRNSIDAGASATGNFFIKKPINGARKLKDGLKNTGKKLKNDWEFRREANKAIETSNEPERIVNQGIERVRRQNTREIEVPPIERPPVSDIKRDKPKYPKIITELPKQGIGNLKWDEKGNIISSQKTQNSQINNNLSSVLKETSKAQKQIIEELQRTEKELKKLKLEYNSTKNKEKRKEIDQKINQIGEKIDQLRHKEKEFGKQIKNNINNQEIKPLRTGNNWDGTLTSRSYDFQNKPKKSTFGGNKWSWYNGDNQKSNTSKILKHESDQNNNINENIAGITASKTITQLNSLNQENSKSKRKIQRDKDTLGYRMDKGVEGLIKGMIETSSKGIKTGWKKIKPNSSKLFTENKSANTNSNNNSNVQKTIPEKITTQQTYEQARTERLRHKAVLNSLNSLKKSIDSINTNMIKGDILTNPKTAKNIIETQNISKQQRVDGIKKPPKAQQVINKTNEQNKNKKWTKKTDKKDENIL